VKIQIKFFFRHGFCMLRNGSGQWIAKRIKTKAALWAAFAG
jgi:hypothetical protein